MGFTCVGSFGAVNDFWVVANQIFLECSSQKIGEMIPNLTVAYFSDGWFNHQLVILLQL